MSELIPISALIGDRTYRIKVEPKDEVQVRQTLQIINNKILELKNQFVGKEMQDYIAMTLLWFATQPAPKTSAPAADDSQVRKGLLVLEQLLDEELKG